MPRVRRRPEALSPDHVPEVAAARFADRLDAVLRGSGRERVVVLGPLVDGALDAVVERRPPAAAAHFGAGPVDLGGAPHAAICAFSRERGAVRLLEVIIEAAWFGRRARRFRLAVDEDLLLERRQRVPRRSGGRRRLRRLAVQRLEEQEPLVVVAVPVRHDGKAEPVVEPQRRRVQPIHVEAEAGRTPGRTLPFGIIDQSRRDAAPPRRLGHGEARDVGRVAVVVPVAVIVLALAGPQRLARRQAPEPQARQA